MWQTSDPAAVQPEASVLLDDRPQLLGKPLTRAAETKRHSILVIAIDPGGLQTDMTARIKRAERVSRVWVEVQKVEEELRLRRPADITPLVHFLASDDSNMMTGRLLQVSSRGGPLNLQL